MPRTPSVYGNSQFVSSQNKEKMHPKTKYGPKLLNLEAGMRKMDILCPNIPISLTRRKNRGSFSEDASI